MEGAEERAMRLSVQLSWKAVVCALAMVGLCYHGYAQQTPTQPARRPTERDIVRDVVNRGAAGQMRAGAVPLTPGGQPVAPGGEAPSGAPRAGAAEAKPRGGVRAVGSAITPTRVGQIKGAYEAILNRPVDYGEVPKGGERLTLSAAEARIPVTQFLDTLALATNWNILATAELETATLRFWVNNITPRQALEILRFHGIYYEFEPETRFLYVMTREQYLNREYGAVIQEEFTIRYADLIDIESILTGLLSSKGKVVADPRTGRLLVWDTEDNLNIIRDTIATLDVPLVPRNFQLAHANADSLLDSIQNLLSERGIAFADPRLNVVTVTDLPTRLEQVAEFIDTIDQKVDTRTWTLNYADPEDIHERIETLVPEEMGVIVTDELIHQISVTAIPERLDEVDALIKTWDIKRKQVQIEAYLVSVSISVVRNFGIDWAYFGESFGDPYALRRGLSSPDLLAPGPAEGQRISVGTLPTPVFARDPFTLEPLTDIEGQAIIQRFRGNQLSYVLNYLETHGDATILSRPRVTVQDGEEAVFQNTEEQPYQEGGISQYAVGTQGGNRVIPLNVRFITVGTVLRVKPRITDEDNILLDLSVEDSTAEKVVVTVGNQQSTVPQKRQASAQTQVLVHDEQTVVIGGLRGARFEDDVDRVPFLGELPLLGRLFKNTLKDHQQQDLFVFITPTLVDEHTTPEAEHLADVDESIRATARHDDKTLLERVESRVRRGRGEIFVSIGHTGAMHTQGEMVTMDELHEKCLAVEHPSVTTVVIRAHSNAPGHVAAEVEKMAEEIGLKVEFEEDPIPFVPALRNE